MVIIRNLLVLFLLFVSCDSRVRDFHKYDEKGNAVIVNFNDNYIAFHVLNDTEIIGYRRNYEIEDYEIIYAGEISKAYTVEKFTLKVYSEGKQVRNIKINKKQFEKIYELINGNDKSLNLLLQESILKIVLSSNDTTGI